MQLKVQTQKKLKINPQKSENICKINRKNNQTFDAEFVFKNNSLDVK